MKVCELIELLKKQEPGVKIEVISADIDGVLITDDPQYVTVDDLGNVLLMTQKACDIAIAPDTIPDNEVQTP